VCYSDIHLSTDNKRIYFRNF